MANVKITDLAALTNPASTDVLPIVDVGADVTKKISIADLLENAGSGTASAPGIAFDGDSNTGIYRPGADQLAISTNGSERMRINNTGDALFFGNIRKDNASSSLIVSGGNGSASGANIVLNGQSGSPLNTIQFRYGSNESMRIDSSGRLGLGTSSPNQQLTLAQSGSIGGSIQLQDSRTTGATTNDVIGQILFWSQDGDRLSSGTQLGAFIKGIQAESFGRNTALVFGTNDTGTSVTERLRIDPQGRVGIGTTSVGANLEIAANSATTGPSLRLSNLADVINANAVLGTLEFFTGDNSGAGNSVVASIQAITETTTPADNSALLFKTKSNTERARIDSSGRLLVGTSTSVAAGSVTASTLQVSQGTGGVGATFYSVANGAGPGGILVLGHGRATASGLLSSDDFVGQIRFAGGDGVDLQTLAAQISAEVDGTPGANDMPGRLVFSTTGDGASSPTERMRITSDGQTYWSASAPDSSTFGTSIGRASLKGLFETFRNVTGGGNTAIIGGNAGQCNIAGDGDLFNTNGTYAAISDAKLKENITNANSQWNDLKNLRVCNYNFKADTGYNTHTQIGLIAQEVELVSPRLVSELVNEQTGECTKTVNYSVLYMKAVKALQEAMERIETLEAKVAALEAS